MSPRLMRRLCPAPMATELELHPLAVAQRLQSGGEGNWILQADRCVCAQPFQQHDDVAARNTKRAVHLFKRDRSRCREHSTQRSEIQVDLFQHDLAVALDEADLRAVFDAELPAAGLWSSADHKKGAANGCPFLINSSFIWPGAACPHAVPGPGLRGLRPDDELRPSPACPASGRARSARSRSRSGFPRSDSPPARSMRSGCCCSPDPVWRSWCWH